MSTKIHTIVDALGNPTGFHLTPGQAYDLDGADVLLKGTPAAAVLADKAYDADSRVIESLLVAGKTIVIPPRSMRNVQREYDRHCYEKTARNFLSTVHLARTVVWFN